MIACNKKGNCYIQKPLRIPHPKLRAALIFQDKQHAQSNELDLLHMYRLTEHWQLAPEAQNTGNKTHTHKNCAQILRLRNTTPPQIHKL